MSLAIFFVVFVRMLILIRARNMMGGGAPGGAPGAGRGAGRGAGQ